MSTLDKIKGAAAGVATRAALQANEIAARGTAAAKQAIAVVKKRPDVALNVIALGAVVGELLEAVFDEKPKGGPEDGAAQ